MSDNYKLYESLLDSISTLPLVDEQIKKERVDMELFKKYLINEWSEISKFAIFKYLNVKDKIVAFLDKNDREAAKRFIDALHRVNSNWDLISKFNKAPEEIGACLNCLNKDDVEVVKQRIQALDKVDSKITKIKNGIYNIKIKDYGDRYDKKNKKNIEKTFFATENEIYTKMSINDSDYYLTRLDEIQRMARDAERKRREKAEDKAERIERITNIMKETGFVLLMTALLAVFIYVLYFSDFWWIGRIAIGVVILFVGTIVVEKTAKGDNDGRIREYVCLALGAAAILPSLVWVLFYSDFSWLGRILTCVGVIIAVEFSLGIGISIIDENE